MRLIRPDWSLQGVQAFSTTRSGGVSTGPWTSLNLGAACGDDPAAVGQNRRRLQALLPGLPHWLRQVHGKRVIHLDDWHAGIEADAAWTDRPGQVLAILTADCLPIVLADRQARLVAAAHAGWRGLAADIPGHLVRSLPVSAGRLTAWIGPGIGPERYLVGEEVRTAFTALDAALAQAFTDTETGRIRADLTFIARTLLRRAGVEQVLDCGLCTASDPQRFFSYRRDGRCGRMATLTWME
ncbi:MAG: peptidoglycan editing factor PgeF [Wenzhouxiangella sp.]|nr:MAG: peptidoglycan editing factor PgeF [Wenzhouxiangella sp.]